MLKIYLHLLLARNCEDFLHCLPFWLAVLALSDPESLEDSLVLSMMVVIVEQQNLHKAVACHTLSLPLLFTEVLVLQVLRTNPIEVY